MRFKTVLSAALLYLTSTRIARADARELKFDPRIDIAVTAMGSLWWITSEVLKADLVPKKCRWCYRGEDGTDLLNPADAWIRKKWLWEDKASANVASTVLAYVVEPASMMGLLAVAGADEKAIGGFPVDALLVMEATVIAGNVNQLAKYGFARERPFVHFLPRAPSEVRGLTDSPSDDNLSFFSGHATWAFALATASGTIASLREYRLAPVVWGTGLALAGTVGYLRIASDKHYFSDVVTAALVGSAIGIGVPLLFHSARPAEAPPGVTAQPLAPAVRNAISIGGAF